MMIEIIPICISNCVKVIFVSYYSLGAIWGLSRIYYDVWLIFIVALQNFYDNNINAMFSDDNAKKII
jgi:hypothetical protein